MKRQFDFTDDDLRLVLQNMDKEETPTLPENFSDRVMNRIKETDNNSLILLCHRILPWAIAASVILIIGLTITLWPKSQTNIYQDTFASVEEASLILCNDQDSKTIAL